MQKPTPEQVYRVIREHPHVPTVSEIAAVLRADTGDVRACLNALRAQGKVQPLRKAGAA